MSRLRHVISSDEWDPKSKITTPGYRLPWRVDGAGSKGVASAAWSRSTPAEEEDM